MKIRITYVFDPSYGSSDPYWAKSEHGCKCGSSFRDAKDKLIRYLKEKLNMKVPAPEEVEI